MPRPGALLSGLWIALGLCWTPPASADEPAATASTEAQAAGAAEKAPANEWRLTLGGEFNPVSHGIFDLGFRRGPFSVEILTDTLDIRYAPDFSRGRAWAALRAEGGAAGLMLSPWTDGAPDPSRALLASYGGVELGGLRYLPHGFYAGAGTALRLYTFGPFSDQTSIEIPANTTYASADLYLGFYSSSFEGWSRVGVEAEGSRISQQAHIHLQGRVPLGAGLELRSMVNGGMAENQGIISLTRLGGLNPYVIPLAGAGWAEWWVEDYLTARVGIGYRAEHYELSAFADGAAFEGREALGAGAAVKVYFKRLWAVEGQFGYAPSIPRQEGVGRTSVYVLLSRQWGGFRQKR